MSRSLLRKQYPTSRIADGSAPSSFAFALENTRAYANPDLKGTPINLRRQDRPRPSSPKSPWPYPARRPATPLSAPSAIAATTFTIAATTFTTWPPLRVRRGRLPADSRQAARILWSLPPTRTSSVAAQPACGCQGCAWSCSPPRHIPWTCCAPASRCSAACGPEAVDHNEEGARNIADGLLACLGSMLLYWHHYAATAAALKSNPAPTPLLRTFCSCCTERGPRRVGVRHAGLAHPLR